MAYATFDSANARVTLSLTAVRTSAGADTTGTIQRSVDQIRWGTVRGGSGVTITATAAPLYDYEYTPDVANYYRAVTGAGTFSDSLTPASGGLVWLKHIRFPFLSRAVNLADASDLTFQARTGLFPVIGRSYPVAVTATRATAAYDLSVRTDTVSDRQYLEAMLATGDTLFLQCPAATPDGFGWPVPTGYYAVGDYTESRDGAPWDRRTFTLPLTAVAAPDPSITGTTITWQGIVNGFASWSALIAAEATWTAVTQTLGVPGDVIVS